MFYSQREIKVNSTLNKALALKKKGLENGKWMEQRNNQFWQCRGKLITTNALMVDIGGCAICCIFWQIASLYLSQKMSPLLRSTKLLSHHILSLYSKQQQLWLNLVKQERGRDYQGITIATLSRNYANQQQLKGSCQQQLNVRLRRTEKISVACSMSSSIFQTML